MAHRLPLHWAVARRSFRRHSTYRGATFAGAFTNTVFGFIQAYVLLAVFRERSDVGGFDAIDVVTFTFATQGLLAVVAAFGQLELAERIAGRRGQRPLPPLRPAGVVAGPGPRPGRLPAPLPWRRRPSRSPPWPSTLRLPADAGVWAES